MYISWSRRPCKARLDRGYFNCPHCASRQPCDLFHLVLRTYLYEIIPTRAEDEPLGPEFYLCRTCHREYESDSRYAYDFGPHALPDTRTWQCFKCGGEVSHERFECPQCGYRLQIEAWS